LESIESELLLVVLFPSVVIPALMDALIDIEDVCVGHIVIRSLENEIIDQICGVTTCDISHEPLDLREETYMTWFKAHTN
jgi:hypothetical protein